MDITPFPLSRRGFLRATMIVGGSAVTAGILGACTREEAISGQDDASSPATEQPESRTITDDQGRSVEVPAAVTKIAVTGFGARAVTYAGAVDRLVGVSDRDKSEVNAALPFAKANLDFLSTLPSVCTGGAQDTVYEEQMLLLAPDVIISTTTDPAANDELQTKMATPVVYIGMNDSDIFEESFYKSLSLLGGIFGTTSWTDGGD